MSRIPTLGDLAAFITSKNAGPFVVTIDVVFKTDSDYRAVRDSGTLTPEVVADLYRRDVADVTGIYCFDPARAIKVTISRSQPSGSPGDSDVYGAQQHVPLMNLPLPFLRECGDDT
jgi:hypothetical protein